MEIKNTLTFKDVMVGEVLKNWRNKEKRDRCQMPVYSSASQAEHQNKQQCRESKTLVIEKEGFDFYQETYCNKYLSMMYGACALKLEDK